MNGLSDVSTIIPATFGTTLQTYLSAERGSEDVSKASQEMKKVFDKVHGIQAAWKVPTHEQAERAVALLQELKQKYDEALGAARSLFFIACQKDDRYAQFIRPYTIEEKYRDTQRTELDSASTALATLLQRWTAKKEQFTKECEDIKGIRYSRSIDVESLTLVSHTVLNSEKPILQKAKVRFGVNDPGTLQELFRNLQRLFGVDDESLVTARVRTFSSKKPSLPDTLVGENRDLIILTLCSKTYFRLMAATLSQRAIDVQYSTQTDRFPLLVTVGEFGERRIEIYKKVSDEIFVRLQAKLPLRRQATDTPFATVDADLTFTLTKHLEISSIVCSYTNITPNKSIKLADVEKLKSVFTHVAAAI